MSAEGLPEFGFVFDIDGVLIRGWDLLPNAKESLKKVHDSGVPYLFVTNNGMDTEDERAKILSKQFDIPVTNKSMVLNHSALQVVQPCCDGRKFTESGAYCSCCAAEPCQ